MNQDSGQGQTKEDQVQGTQDQVLKVCRALYVLNDGVDEHSAIFVSAGEVPATTKGTFFHVTDGPIYREQKKNVVVLEMREDDKHVPSKCWHFVSLKIIGTMPVHKMNLLRQACLNVGEVFSPRHPVPVCVPWADHVVQDLFQLRIVDFMRIPPPSIYLRRSPKLVLK